MYMDTICMYHGLGGIRLRVWLEECRVWGF